jgi:hypothetical protein
VAATAGVGNAMGWFGGQAEYYVARDRASLFAGLGYTLEVDEGDPSGATFALGARGFTLMASFGAGHGHAFAGLGLGYTWKSRVP